jgi:HAD superfamily hydrolase (TIGR01509 family)
VTSGAGFPAVLLDLDGTLVDSESAGQAALRLAWTEVLPSHPLAREDLALYLGRREQDVFAELGQRHRLTQDEASRVFARYQDLYSRALSRCEPAVLAGASSALAMLKRCVPRLGLVTGSTRSQVAACLGSEPLLDRSWDVVVTGEDTCTGKPSPEPYRVASRRLGVPAHRCLVIEDSESGVLSGRAAGASVLHVGTFEPRRSLLADLSIPRLGQLSIDLLARLWQERPLSGALEPDVFERLADRLEAVGLVETLRLPQGAGAGLWEQWQDLVERVPTGPEGDLACLQRLWIRGEQRLARAAVCRALGDRLVDDLLEAEVLVESDGLLGTRLRLLMAAGALLLKEAPQRSLGRRLLSKGTYLDGCSVEFVESMLDTVRRRRMVPRRVLEIGVGTGVVLARLLRELPEAEGVGTDIDGRAVHLAQANLALARVWRRCRVVQGDRLAAVERTSRFDLVVCNPPYRIIPTGVPYPDPLSRLGRGEDGLGLIESLLGGLGDLLDPSGLAVIGVEMPLSSGRPDTVLARLRAACPGLSLQLEPTAEPVPVERIARVCAEKCMLGRVESHQREIERRYRELGVDGVLPGLLVLGACGRRT